MIKRELIRVFLVALLTGLIGGCSKDGRDTANESQLVVIETKISESTNEISSETTVDNDKETENVPSYTTVSIETECELIESEAEVSDEATTEAESSTEIQTTSLDITEETTISVVVATVTQPETHIPTEPQTQPVTDYPTEPENQPSTESQTQPVTETQTQPQTEPQTQSQTQPQTEPQTQAQTEPQTEPETENQYVEETDVDTANVDYYYADIMRDGEVVQVLVYTERGVRKQADWIVEKFRTDVNYDSSWTKEHKAILAFKWVAGFMTYDINVLKDVKLAFNNVYEWSGHGICDTYARALITILNSCNVEAHYMVSWSRDHAYVKVVIDGKEYICNSLGTEFKSSWNQHLAIGWYDREYYDKYFESIYGSFDDPKQHNFTAEELNQFLMEHSVYLFRALASETEIPSDIYMDDNCGSAGAWFELGYGVSERTLSFPGLTK